MGGRAAVVLHECDLDMLLHLPTGLFMPRGEGPCAVLRQEAGQRNAVDQATVDLRPAHQQAFRAQANPLQREDLDEFVALCCVGQRHKRKPTWSAESPEGRWRVYSCEELVARDKASLDIFWLKDESLADSDKLPPPDVIAQEIVEDLQAALEQFKLIAGDLGGDVAESA